MCASKRKNKFDRAEGMMAASCPERCKVRSSCWRLQSILTMEISGVHLEMAARRTLKCMATKAHT